MSNTFKEKDYQRLILNYLKDKNDYLEGHNFDYLKEYSVDRAILKRFLEATQADKLDKLSPKEDKILYFIKELNKKIESEGLIEVIKNGVIVGGIKFNLLYIKENNFDTNLQDLYNNNILSVTEELVYNDADRVDLVLFLNGIAVITLELKCESANQSYHDAIKQYKKDRDNRDRLFKFNCGSLVHFAVDTSEVYMTTKLDGENTTFLPFNIGTGNGAGNPVNINGKFKTYYMWEDILSRDTIIGVIGKMVVMEDNTKLIFPRYHQLDCIRSIESDIESNVKCKNYLIKHSTGSGKTKTIVWLADLLSNMYYNPSSARYDKIIIMTDRLVIDEQLQSASSNIIGSSRLAKITKAKQLKKELTNPGTRVVVCTIQKMSYIDDMMKQLSKSKNTRFAIIIDEAHQSTSGRHMEGVKSVTNSLSGLIAREKENGDIETVTDHIVRRSMATGKKDNISMFAFTATPKKETLSAFGTDDLDGKKKPFHLYSMTQAIEEGYILDVLENYKVYKRFFETNLNNVEVGDLTATKKEILRKVFAHVDKSDENIQAKSEIIVDDFFKVTDKAIGGRAKAMVVASSRDCAMKYKIAIDSLLSARGSDIKTLVAFTGELRIDGKDYTEVKANGVENIKATFNQDDYRILIVANKFQTGFDQPLLNTMFIDKVLNGVSSVQTLSRLNRTYRDGDIVKDSTYVVDFKNSFEDISADFKLFADCMSLKQELSLDTLVSVYNKVVKLGVVKTDTVYIYTKHGTKEQALESAVFMNNCIEEVKSKSLETKRMISQTMKKFLSTFSYVAGSHVIKDENIIAMEEFCRDFVLRLQLLMRDDSAKIDISKFLEHKDIKIVLDNEVMSGSEESGLHTTSNIEEKLLTLKITDNVKLTTDSKEKLSYLIEEINLITRHSLDSDDITLLELGVDIVQNEHFKNHIKKKIENNTNSEAEAIFNSDFENRLTTKALKEKNGFYSKVKKLLNNKEAFKDVKEAFFRSFMHHNKKEEQVKELS